MSYFLLIVNGKTHLFLRNQYQVIIWRNMLHSLVPWKETCFPILARVSKIKCVRFVRKIWVSFHFLLSVPRVLLRISFVHGFQFFKNRMLPLFFWSRKGSQSKLWRERSAKSAFHFELKDWPSADSKWSLLEKGMLSVLYLWNSLVIISFLSAYVTCIYLCIYL